MHQHSRSGRTCRSRRRDRAGAFQGRPVRSALAITCLLAVPFLVIPGVAAQDRSEAIAALSQGHHDQALRILTDLLDRSPRDHGLLTLRGIALNQSGRLSEALVAYRAALDLAPEYLAALQGAAEIEFHQRLQGARGRLEKVVSVHSQNVTAHAMLGVLAFERDDCTAAVRHFAAAAPALAENAQALWLFGQCAFREGDASAAARIFRQVLDLDPGNTSVRFNLALSWFESGEHARAIEALRPAASGGSPESEVLSLLADAYLSDGQVPVALETLKRAVDLHPHQERHYVDLANLCMEQEAHDLGLEILDAGIRNIPRSARLHGMRGVLLAQLGNLDQAEAAFALATELEPGQAPGRIGLSITLQQAGRHSESIPILREQALASPDDPVVNTMLGRALLQQRDLGEVGLQEARSALERAVASDPTATGAWVELGRLFLKAGQSEEAITALERAVDTAPEDRQALYQLMLAYRKAGQLDRTRELSQTLRAMVVRDREEETQQARFRLVKEAQ